MTLRIKNDPDRQNCIFPFAEISAKILIFRLILMKRHSVAWQIFQSEMRPDIAKQSDLHNDLDFKYHTAVEGFVEAAAQLPTHNLG